MKDVELTETVTTESNEKVNLVINQSITLQGANEDITITGQKDSRSIGILVTGGNVTIQNLTLKDFGSEANTISGDKQGSVIQVPSTATNTNLTARNLTIDGFCRNGIKVLAGKAMIDKCKINCVNKSETKVLMYGITAWGSSANSKVNLTVKDASIMSPSKTDTYKEWDSAGIAVWEYTDATIENCNIGYTGYGVCVEDSTGGQSTVTITGDNTYIANVKGNDTTNTISLVMMSSQWDEEDKPKYNQSKLKVETGTFIGDVAVGSTGSALNSDLKDALDITGGNFSTDVIEYVSGSEAYANITDNNASKYCVGQDKIEDIAVAGADVKLLQAGSGNLDLDLPSGVKVTNETETPITVNGSTVGTDETITSYVAPETPSEVTDAMIEVTQIPDVSDIGFDADDKASIDDARAAYEKAIATNPAYEAILAPTLEKIEAAEAAYVAAKHTAFEATEPDIELSKDEFYYNKKAKTPMWYRDLRLSPKVSIMR